MKHITLIGAGNLATQLGQALVQAGFKIDQVFSRTEKSACELELLKEIMMMLMSIFFQ